MCIHVGRGIYLCDWFMCIHVGRGIYTCDWFNVYTRRDIYQCDWFNVYTRRDIYPIEQRRYVIHCCHPELVVLYMNTILCPTYQGTTIIFCLRVMCVLQIFYYVDPDIWWYLTRLCQDYKCILLFQLN